MASASPSLGAPGNWVVSLAERAQYDAMFAAADADRDGFVSGAEIKHVFLDSGLPHQTLAHIWALCDTGSVGKLSREQFSLAMWLVGRASRGTPPPAALAPDMLPPSCRKQPSPLPALPAAVDLLQSNEPALNLGPQPTPEMEAIAREVDALARERLALDAELAAKQRDLSVKGGEADSLQSELDTLTATLKQLENQKGEAQKRLNDLKSQVEKLRSQVSAQEAAAAETEAEVMARRAAAQTLKEKERALQRESDDAEREAEALTARLRRTVIALSQANIKISHLEEQHRLISEGTAALASGGAAAATAADLQPQFTPEHLDKIVRGATPSDALEDEPYAANNSFGAMNGSAAGFGADPFTDASAFAPAPHDPFAPSDAHKPMQDGFASDPFAPSAGADPFAGDAFAPQSGDKQDGAWESDPFAVLHAPTRASAGAGAGGGGGTSPRPVLPPKAHKTPPPRPAPPRPNPPGNKSRAAMDFTEDPFKDYRYEDPFNIEDPFADPPRRDPPRPTSVAGFGSDDFAPPPRLNGRVSAPPGPPADSWAAWPASDWGDDAWAKPAHNNNAITETDAWSKPASTTDAWSSKNTNSASSDWKTDNWANKSENWATDWGTDHNKNLNETWPSSTLPSKKEKSPKPVKYAKSLVHTIGGIGRKHGKEKKKAEARGAEPLPSEEQQWAWAAAESRRLQAEADARRQQEDAELQLALAISRQEK